MPSWSVLVLCFVGIVVGLPVQAQGLRYELGQRLRAFEAAWEAQTDKVARLRALAPLEKATPAFFSLRLDRAAQYLDQARFALRSDAAPKPVIVWAASLALKPERRFIDARRTDLAFRLEPYYKTDVEQPRDVELRLSLLHDGKSDAFLRTMFPIERVPWEGRWSFPKISALPEGDHRLGIELVCGGAVVARWEQCFSVAERLNERLEKAKTASAELPETITATDRETVAGLVGVVDALAQARPVETNYPAVRLLTDIEEALPLLRPGESVLPRRKVGESWLWMATRRTTVPVRVWAPELARPETPRPLVIALHGAGGSENMFFDGYGDGGLIRQCQKRGWIVASPRNGAYGAGAELIDELARLYPVDPKRIVLVGHSMGAAQALAAVSRHAERYAAVVPLGGGGRVTATDGLKSVAFFVGVGKRDFALSGARKLHADLKQLGVTNLHLREYDEAEHLLSVQAALPDVFAFLDQVVGR